MGAQNSYFASKLTQNGKFPALSVVFSVGKFFDKFLQAKILEDCSPCACHDATGNNCIKYRPNFQIILLIYSVVSWQLSEYYI